MAQRCVHDFNCCSHLIFSDVISQKVPQLIEVLRRVAVRNGAHEFKS